MKKKIVTLLLAMIISLFVGGMITTVESHALWGNGNSQMAIANNGQVNKTAAKDSDSAFGRILDKYKGVITFVSGIGAITMIGIFIFHFIKLGSTAANPAERSKCTTALIWSGLAAAGLGAVALIVGVFYGMLS